MSQLRTDIRENFGATQFSTFSTVSARTRHSARDCMRPGARGPLLSSDGSAAGASIDNFAFEPHHLHLGNGGAVGRRRIDLDAGDKRPSSSRALMLAACSMTFSRDRPRRLLELSGTEAPTLDEETIFVGQRNGLRHDARLLLRSRR